MVEDGLSSEGPVVEQSGAAEALRQCFRIPN